MFPNSIVCDNGRSRHYSVPGLWFTELGRQSVISIIIWHYRRLSGYAVIRLSPVIKAVGVTIHAFPPTTSIAVLKQTKYAIAPVIGKHLCKALLLAYIR